MTSGLFSGYDTLLQAKAIQRERRAPVRKPKAFLLVGAKRYDMPTFDDVLWLKNLLHDLRVWGGLPNTVDHALTPISQAWSTEAELAAEAKRMGFSL